jgi:hypothetical protein
MAKLYWRVKKNNKWTWKAANYDAVTGLVTPVNDSVYQEEK